MNRLYIITIFYCLLAACSKDAVDEYGDTSFVYLVNTPTDTSAMKPIEYSFAFHPGEIRDTVPLLIKLMGKLKEQNRTVALTVDPSQTTAIAGDYDLPGNIELRAGRAVDTIALVLHHSDRLKTGKFKIRLALQENENFKLGPPANRFIDITFSDMIARPGWWTPVVETNFLAKYSDNKYRLFIEATGIADMTGLSETEQRAYAIIFRDFLARGRENGEVYEDENGQINVSPNLF
ncbi:DUF4843 domain-containing protein [Pseudoflavitalea rhizosphaerae]|uniref:DUF4843 domain-containing protein n=1 Tax=Pseudoflavitalea rhizosphaerae TaxID=1884793 RepID=UPI000F8F2454|nr:DUF4843 domain-containing protein [Pseudoflavitalea rhizosphaerae]